MSSTDDPRATLEGFITDYAAYVSLPENALLGVEMLTEASRLAAVAEVFGSNRNRLIAALVNCLMRGVKSRVFGPQIDLRVVACMILDALEGQGLRSLSLPSADDCAADVIGSFILSGLKP